MTPRFTPIRINSLEIPYSMIERRITIRYTVAKERESILFKRFSNERIIDYGFSLCFSLSFGMPPFSPKVLNREASSNVSEISPSVAILKYSHSFRKRYSIQQVLFKMNHKFSRMNQQIRCSLE